MSVQTVPSSLGASQEPSLVAFPKRPLKATGFRTRKWKRWIVTGWAVLSLAWIGGVAVNLIHKANVQAEMSRQIERELAAACKGPQCAAQAAPSGQAYISQAAIIATYMHFGYRKIALWTLGPPVGALLLVMAGWALCRRNAGPDKGPGTTIYPPNLSAEHIPSKMTMGGSGPV